jgi:5-formyltetrahydrofolate cyclo-ligase
MKKQNNIISVDSAKVIIEKNKIRENIREIESLITENQKQKDADSVFLKIESFSEFQSAKTILIYWSDIYELPTHDYIQKWSAEKQILLPSVCGEDIKIKRFDVNQKMKKGIFGILEPDNLENYTGKIDLVIVPGVAYDLKKNRMGRGKGYYDRFLKDSKVLKWGVGFDCQLLMSIPTYKNDIKMDKIITPTYIID